MKSLVVILLVLSVYNCKAGNDRPYGVDRYGTEGAGQVGQDSSANGYAGASLVSPLASEGFNSPRQRYAPSNAYSGNPTGIGFGGFGWQSGSGSGGPFSRVAAY